MEKQREGSYAEIPGTAIFEAEKGGKIRIINSVKAVETLNNIGIEIGKTYIATGKGGKIKLKIDGISEGTTGIDVGSTEEDIKKINSDTASVWGRTEGTSGVAFLGHLKEFKTRPSKAKGFILGIGNNKVIFDEVDEDEIDESKDTVLSRVLDLL